MRARWNRLLHIFRIRSHEPVYKSLQLSVVYSGDHPGLCDAYWESGEWDDGTEMSDEDLDKLSREIGDLLKEMERESLIQRLG